MSTPMIRILLVALPLALLAGGCTYARHDRISFSAGNAVRANIEGQTINPSKRSMYSTTGLGKNGNLILTTPAAPAAP